MSVNPYAPPRSAVGDVPRPQDAAGTQIAFFAVTVTKLLVLSFCTLGLYQIFWFYQNWKLVRVRTGESLMPVMRPLFAVFFCYQLFKLVREHGPGLSSNRLAAGPLAAAWIIPSLLWKLPDPFGLVVFVAVFALVPVQAAANTVNAAVAPAHDRSSRFAAWNWVTIVLAVCCSC